MKKEKIFIVGILLIVICTLIIIIPNTFAKQGCCSHHGGQDYCDTNTGKWVCNDGTYSPTCTCSKNSSSVNKNKTTKSSSSKKSTTNTSTIKSNNDNDNKILLISFIIAGCICTLYMYNNYKK